MENAQQTLAEIHNRLNTVDTNGVGQPHADVFKTVLDALLRLLPIVIGLFHHATSQPPVELPISVVAAKKLPAEGVPTETEKAAVSE